MPSSPVQLALVALELILVFAGGGLLLTLLFNPRQRQRWLDTSGLVHWQISPSEFLLLAACVMLGAFFPQAVVQLLTKDWIAAAPDKTGLEVAIYGGAFHGGMLLGCLVFVFLRKLMNAERRYELRLREGPSLSWLTVLRYAGGTLLVALPVVALFSVGWNYVLRTLSLPDAPQDLIAIFAKTKSPVVVAGMLGVACILAPITEELIFRRGMYRYLRQNHVASVAFIALAIAVQATLLLQAAGEKFVANEYQSGGLKALGALGVLLAALAVFWFGSRSRTVEREKRPLALVLSGLCFGILHGSWMGFLPLAIFGMILALAYEATGSIRVPIIVHSLFNLNTVIIVLAGLADVAS